MTPIAFVQPFGLHSAGGGPRILRALLADAERPYLSICTHPRPPETLAAHEVALPVRPYFGRIEQTRLSRPFHYLDALCGGRFKRQLAALCRAHDVDAIHAIPHGLEFWYAYEVARELGIPYVLNVHDHLTYNLQGHPRLAWALDRLAEAWRGADQRLVISDAMGAAYCDAYGRRPYATVTDGLDAIAPAPLPRSEDTLDVYFMGALHLSYQDNFAALLTALDRIAGRRPPGTVTMTSRGSALNAPSSSIPVHNLPWASEAEVACDLDDVNWLYFPLPFGPEHDDFVRYSLSTKLVSYLGSGLPILYHGPAHSAAARLLGHHDAAVQVHAPSPDAVATALQRPVDRDRIVENALGLARSQFSLDEQRRRFWNALNGRAPDRTAPDPSLLQTAPR